MSKARKAITGARVEAEDAEAERIRPRDGLPNWRCRQVTR
jgi:hypothetical protein